MAWYVVIRKESKKPNAILGNLFYVVERKASKKGYIYKFQPTVKTAKVFHNEVTAGEWADEMREEHPNVAVMSETDRQKINESSSNIRKGVPRGKYNMKKKQHGS